MCGIIGVQGLQDGQSKFYQAAPDAYIALCMLQHRGQSGAGIVVQNRNNFARIIGNGEIPKVFQGILMSDIWGNTAVGQCRYPTTGALIDLNNQPIEGEFRGHKFYLVHNGNAVNFSELASQITGCALPANCSDTYVIARLISASRKRTMEQALIDVARKIRGSFNLIVLYRNYLYAIKDRFGFHPLQMGVSQQAIVIASESCVFKTVDARLVRDIEPGELIAISPDGEIHSVFWTRDRKLLLDIFEFIYFCRPDSKIHGILVSDARKSMGRMLAEMHNLSLDTIAAVPDSGLQAAWGFYEQSVKLGREIEYLPDGIIRPHIAGGRTFIVSVSNIRSHRIKMKYQEQEDLIIGMRTGWADDSVVRGETVKKFTKKIRLAGAKEVHFCISSPPYCYREVYGIDTYRQGEMLLAWEGDCDPKRMAQIVEADSLNYLSLQETKRSIIRAKRAESPLTEDSFHAAPFDGIYADGMGDYEKAAA